MLKEFISLVLEAQRGIMYPPARINAKTQSEVSQEQTNDKTFLSPEEVAQEISELQGDDIFINFASSYKDHPVPSVDINSYARYATPHGVYTYLFNERNMRDLFLNQRIGRVRDFMNRDYFHIIKLNTEKSPTLNSDKTSDFYALRNLDKDILNSPHANTLSKEILEKDYNTRVFPKYKSDIKEMLRVSLLSLPEKRSINPIKRGITVQNYLSNIYRSSYTFKSSVIAKNIFYAYDSLCRSNDDNITFEEFIESITIFLISHLDNLYLSKRSRKYNPNYTKGSTDNSKYFLYNIYQVADILSYITPNPKQGSGRHNDSARMSMLLHAIGIDAIVDKGSSTLHSKQPEQAVFIGWGPHVPYENLGTYQNIFANCTPEELKNLYYNFIIWSKLIYNNSICPIDAVYDINEEQVCQFIKSVVMPIDLLDFHTFFSEKET